MRVVAHVDQTPQGTRHLMNSHCILFLCASVRGRTASIALTPKYTHDLLFSHSCVQETFAAAWFLC